MSDPRNHLPRQTSDSFARAINAMQKRSLADVPGLTIVIAWPLAAGAGHHAKQRALLADARFLIGLRRSSVTKMSSYRRRCGPFTLLMATFYLRRRGRGVANTWIEPVSTAVQTRACVIASLPLRIS